MNSRLREQLAHLPDYLSNHLMLTLIAMAAGLFVSMPLAVLAVRVKRLQGPILAVTSAIQTVPALALLAFMVLVFGIIGVIPALIALTLYSVLPILRNTVTGLLEVEPAYLEAARGIGMTDNQMLFQVQFPLATPVIIAGVRTATVWVVGMATLATPIGATSLGNYIFSGLQTRNDYALAVGSIAAAVLALTLDKLIALIESSVRNRNWAEGIIGAAGVLAAVIVGMWPLAGMAARAFEGGERMPTVVIGAKSFTEQYILADLIELQLEENGIEARSLDSLGSTVVFDALAKGQIDCYVDYSGTVWANYMQRSDVPSAQAVLDEMTVWLQEEHGIVCPGTLGFENAYALAMRRDHAERLRIETVDDLVAHAPELSLGSDYEFFERPEWDQLRDTYGLDFQKLRTLDPALMYSAVDTGQVDVITAFSSDGRIAALDLKVLADTRDAFPPYDTVLLVSRDLADNEAVMAALKPLIGAIDGEAMREANKLVDVDKEPIGAAASFLFERVRR